jgi:lysophospholipase L1-like esterase
VKAKFIFLFLFSLFIFGVFLELGIRISGKYRTVSEKAGNGFISPFDVNHSGWNYKHRPNEIIHIKNQEFEFNHQIDHWGYRNSSKPDTSGFGILVLGDSFTEGLGASQDSTWPALLQFKLQIPVYNAGIMGSDPFYAFQALKTHQFPVLPRLIVLMINWSDIADVIIRGGMERFEADSSVHYKTAPWFMPLYQYLHTFRLMLHLGLEYDYMFNSPNEQHQKIQSALTKLASICEQFKEECSKRNAEFVVIVQPLPQEYYLNLDRRINFRIIDELILKLNQMKIESINLRPILEQKLKSSQDWKAISWPIDGHFNGKGYNLVAEIVASKLKS